MRLRLFSLTYRPHEFGQERIRGLSPYSLLVWVMIVFSVQYTLSERINLRWMMERSSPIISFRFRRFIILLRVCRRTTDHVMSTTPIYVPYTKEHGRKQLRVLVTLVILYRQQHFQSRSSSAGFRVIRASDIGQAGGQSISRAPTF